MNIPKPDGAVELVSRKTKNFQARSEKTGVINFPCSGNQSHTVGYVSAGSDDPVPTSPAVLYCTTTDAALRK